MAALLSLPNEILHRIAYYADREELLQLRLACRSLSNVSRKWLFRYARVVPTEESCEKFETILNDPLLASCVTKVYLDTANWDHVSFGPDIDIEEYDDDKGEELFLPRRYGKLFNRLKEFPRLQGAVLRFAHECYGLISLDSLWYDCQQEPPFRESVLGSFMESLSSLPHPIQELGIRDLQNINQTDETIVGNIKKVLIGLSTLRLNITNEHSEGNGENDLTHDEPHQFFTDLPSFWLQPTLAKLQYLTLYSSNYFGFYPKFDPTGLYFPQLKTLALGNHAFVHDSQLDWILSHGETLTELYLDDCPILYEVAIYENDKTYLDAASFGPKAGLGEKHYAAYDKRWHDYFNAFNDKLPLLRHFRAGHCPHWWDEETTPFEQEQHIKVSLPKDRYMMFCDGFGPSPYMEEMIYRNGEGSRPDCYVEDQKALEELCAKLGQRAECDPDEDIYGHL
ncbi:hypothetical protein P170DRAFT_399698 [Aspergillus steynii IBT 23096]|uniref:F-box domain-containing protein n=1 Tax=Aspergillus steynii IBT 23096 TaxID=1392250 RepID=A0A2I2GRM6_9EURO|nr:uncharacterized protein P170DRAFT_399698 [Aspergillus steynii IBT 23096]PLB55531.1 hypothetical protein P170DRAFT_399698 [Aspergillus steynii IBT 23096]